ncbi:outer membrane beta-barrel protein [Novosphingobium sp. KCTC 2891]|uniref:outer membrane beta-barrel protein n=1 Tax=Novosphingobium sp. KCTC 2891 TaxID=2989730 RepID=UPI002223B320|nr:outer membrane beta-barrel protein [Novosphingobium sp. KCTC 2891]MCW1382715.1 outer membrane beta-barrel protein [Novosphingobium sp. KCTC 2891]
MNFQVFVFGTTMLSNGAAAQNLDFQEPDDVAGRRPQPSYDAQGIRLSGDIFAYPTFGVAGDYQSNLYGSPKNAVGDLAVVANPSLTVQQVRSDSRFSVFTDAQVRRFSKYTRENDEQYTVSGAFSLDRAGGLGLSGDAGYRRFTAERGTVANAFQSGSPLQARDFHTNLSVSKQFNKLRIAATGQYLRVRYDDAVLGGGTVVDQTFRDNRRIGGDVEAHYNVSPRFGLAATVGLSDDRFTDPNPLTNRNATSRRALIGVRYELTRLVEVAFDAGYRSYNFRNKAYADPSGLALHGRVRWYPDALVTVRADLSQDTSTSTFSNVSTVTLTRADIGTDYEYRRNVMVSLRAGGSRERYEGINQATYSYWSTASATWKANKWLSVTGSLGLEGRTRTVAAAPRFSGFRGGLTLRLAR